MNMVTVREVKWGSPDYESELALRDRVLRKPLGMSIYDEDPHGEADDIHLCAFLGDEIVGVTILHPDGGDAAQIRQVAVDEKQRHSGIGRILISCAEEIAAGMGAQKVYLHARKTAVGFYERLGFERVSGEYLRLGGVPHIDMEKKLPAPKLF